MPASDTTSTRDERIDWLRGLYLEKVREMEGESDRLVNALDRMVSELGEIAGSLEELGAGPPEVPPPDAALPAPEPARGPAVA